MYGGCGWQEVGVASGSGWNVWVWLQEMSVSSHSSGCGCKEIYHITYPYSSHI